jgi:hypothetical protein
MRLQKLFSADYKNPHIKRMFLKYEQYFQKFKNIGMVIV